MDWTSLTVSIVSALAAVIAAYFAYLATRTSDRANKLAGEANEFAHQANEQAERFFSESGSQISVNLFRSGDHLNIGVMSTGRLAATVQYIQLEFESSAESAAAQYVLNNAPFTLESTQRRDLSIDQYKLASLSGTYGGMHQWRAAAVLGDGRISWSSKAEISHPSEPTLKEIMTSVARATNDIIRELNSNQPLSKDRLQELSELLTRRRKEYARIGLKFRALPPNSRPNISTQLANVEMSQHEIARMLAERFKSV
jgi:hypothetical protein